MGECNVLFYNSIVTTTTMGMIDLKSNSPHKREHAMSLKYKTPETKCNFQINEVIICYEPNETQRE